MAKIWTKSIPRIQSIRKGNQPLPIGSKPEAMNLLYPKIMRALGFIVHLLLIREFIGVGIDHNTSQLAQVNKLGNLIQ